MKIRLQKVISFFIIFIFILTLSLLAVSCSSNDNDYGGKVIAKVNEIKITQKQFENRYNIFGEDKDQFFFINDDLIPNYILLDEANRQEIVVSENEVSEAMVVFASNHDLTIDQFKELASLKGIDINVLNKIFKEQVLISKLLEQTIVMNYVDDREALNFYLENQNDMVVDGDVQKFEVVQENIKIMLNKVRKKVLIRNYVKSLADKGSVEILY